MTHDELLAKIEDYFDYGSYTTVLTQTLRAVVELHKPEYLGEALEGGDELACLGCKVGTSQFAYPCPTIQAIEKELK